MFKTQAEAKRIIQEAIDTNPKAVVKGLMMVYQGQTASEQASHITQEANNIGFSAFDAEILTSFAQQVERGRTLSPKQIVIARAKVRKYWKQLAIMSGKMPTRGTKATSQERKSA